ncbi:MAG: tetratricopeptide repeat protein, partial [Rhodospirillales bacterium]|nr:tetratricopeptide repeat protein [Rhodospirillales bacterium]
RLGRSAAAAAACRGALEIDPKMAEAWTNLGNALQSLGQMEDAEKAQREAIRLNPDYATAQYNLGNLLSDLWRAAEACECFRRALDLDPDDASARGNHLMNLLYDEAIDEAQLFEEHTRWAPAVSSRRKRNYAIHPDPDRRLRIGYVSPDFRTHSCAYFLEPLFANHNDESVETFAYSGVQRPDGVTARLRTLVHNWRDIHDLDDGAAAETVIGDKIDILVDLAGYSRGGRPGLFQSRPAPVQVTWLGYPATTGIAAIDYRLSDAIADPEGDADAHHVEKLVRLAGGFHCYQPPSSAPEIKPPPALNNGFITFASFNNISKISPDVVAAWARLLSSAPDSRLMLKGKGFDYPQLGERMMAAFEAQGIARERLELLPWIARSDNPISLYERVDIALDTFPYNGTTTTLEALWMGVPVITLAGRRHAARVGASLLTHAGWPELVASDVGGYVECAAALARAPNRLADFRSTARAQLKASPLMDAPGFALKIEAMYGDIWRYWCAAQ